MHYDNVMFFAYTIEMLHEQNGLTYKTILIHNNILYCYSLIVIHYKIVNSLVPIELPDDFSLIGPKKVRYTRSTQNILSQDDKSTYKCNIRPLIKVYENSYFYRSVKNWNKLPYCIRQLYYPAYPISKPD